MNLLDRVIGAKDGELDALLSTMDEERETNIPRTSSLDRVSTWKNFVGNTEAVQRLRMDVAAARIRKQMMPNVLIYGPAGCGKTTLAKIVARELGCKLFEVTGSSMSTQADLIALCDNIRDAEAEGLRSIVFIDEVHGITKGKGLSEDIWLPLLEDNALHYAECKEQLSDITWIGATTDPGFLSDAIRRRFPLSISLTAYTRPEIGKMVWKYCKRNNVKIENKAIRMIAYRSRYRPAIAIHHLLRQAMTVATVDTGKAEGYIITLAHTQKAMDLAGVWTNGLKREDLLVLKALYRVYPKGLGAKNLADTTDLALNVITGMVLPFIQTEGWAVTTHRRFMTKKGVAFYKKMMREHKRRKHDQR